MAGFKKEAYLAEYINDPLLNYFKNDWFLSNGADWSAFVEDDRINATLMGAQSPVVKGAPMAALTPQKRTDTVDYIGMNYYRPANSTLVQFADEYGRMVGQLQTIVPQQKADLANAVASEGIHNTSPFINTPSTPIIQTPAGNTTLSDGKREITATEIFAIRAAFNTLYPGLKGIKLQMVIDEVSYANLCNKNSTLQAQVGYQQGPGTIRFPYLDIADIMLFSDSRTPFYSISTGQRAVYGTTYVAASHHKAAVLMAPKRSYGTAIGTFKEFLNENDANWQGDILSYGQFAYAGPLSSDLQSNLQYMGAILRT